MSVKPSVNTLKSTTTTTNKDVVSYNTTKKRVVCKNTRKLQQVPTKVLASQLERSRSLALQREGKINGALMRVTIEIYEIGLEVLESKQQQSTSYATSRRSGFRADKTSRLMEMHTLFKTWNTGASRSNYPVFHLNVIHDIIKQVCKKSDITDNRTMFTSREPPSYRKIIIDLSKEVGTSMFDITGFMKRYDRS